MAIDTDPNGDLVLGPYAVQVAMRQGAIRFAVLPTDATFWELDPHGLALRPAQGGPELLCTKVTPFQIGEVAFNADSIVGQSHRLFFLNDWTLIVPANLPSPTHPPQEPEESLVIKAADAAQYPLYKWPALRIATNYRRIKRLPPRLSVPAATTFVS